MSQTLEQMIHDIVKQAVKAAYFELQEGEQEVAPADKQDANETADAGKRKRRTRAEIEADARAELAKAAKPQAVQQNAQPEKFQYATLQNAVIAFLENYSGTPEEAKAAAQKILSQFGVAKAQQLQPEQWQECYEMFTGSEEESLA